MLDHNIFTDTLVFVVMSLFGLWFAFAFAAALPVLVCFFYYPIMLFIPVFAYIFANAVFIDHDEIGHEEQATAMLLLKRLAAYTLFASVVFAMLLWPFYLGQGYTAVVTNTAKALGISLSFWTPGWVNVTLSFSWPFHFPWPEQITLAISVGAIGVEQTLFIWNYLYFWAYGPRNSTAYGWALGRSRHNEGGNEITTKTDLVFDLEAGTATVAAGLAVGDEKTSFEATVTEGAGEDEEGGEEGGEDEEGGEEGGEDEEGGEEGGEDEEGGEEGGEDGGGEDEEEDEEAKSIENPVVAGDLELALDEIAGLRETNVGLQETVKRLETAAEARNSSVFASLGGVYRSADS
jgi:hypothetical protein